MQGGMWVRLADRHGEPGVSCGVDGLTFGFTPMLERAKTRLGQSVWTVRAPNELSETLTKAYNIAVDVASKAETLGRIAERLNRNDLAMAQLMTLHLITPNTSPRAGDAGLMTLAAHLGSISLLKGFDRDQHPRWPAGAAGHQGGRFRPAGSVDANPMPHPGNDTSVVSDVLPGPASKHDRCVQQCLHLLPSPSGDLQSSEFRRCYRECMGRLT